MPLKPPLPLSVLEKHFRYHGGSMPRAPRAVCCTCSLARVACPPPPCPQTPAGAHSACFYTGVFPREPCEARNTATARVAPQHSVVPKPHATLPPARDSSNHFRLALSCGPREQRKKQTSRAEPLKRCDSWRVPPAWHASTCRPFTPPSAPRASVKIALAKPSTRPQGLQRATYVERLHVSTLHPPSAPSCDCENRSSQTVYPPARPRIAFWKLPQAIRVHSA